MISPIDTLYISTIILQIILMIAMIEHKIKLETFLAYLIGKNIIFTIIYLITANTAIFITIGFLIIELIAAAVILKTKLNRKGE